MSEVLVCDWCEAPMKFEESALRETLAGYGNVCPNCTDWVVEQADFSNLLKIVNKYLESFSDEDKEAAIDAAKAYSVKYKGK